MAAPPTVSVLDPGFLCTIQEPLGRQGWRRYGIPTAGAADSWSARLANRLVGNADNAALLEVTIVGPTLRFNHATRIAITGADLSASIDGHPLAFGEVRNAPAGSVLRFGPRQRGARAYLAFGGGIDVPVVLGSRSTDLRSGFGGLTGRRLEHGDEIPVGQGTAVVNLQRHRGPSVFVDASKPIRLTRGPHAAWFPAAAVRQLCTQRWTLTHDSDRMGARLVGAEIPHRRRAEIASVGLPLGAVQVPPDGHPIVMLADRPTTGGYPVIAVVIRADVGRFAQLMPGERACFTVVSLKDALRHFAERERQLTDLESVAPEAEWAGALT